MSTEPATAAGWSDPDHPVARVSPRVAVVAPSLQLSVTLEHLAGEDELHVHAAGQGFWVARMLTHLDAEPVLCAPLGGETGVAIRALLGDLAGSGLVPCFAHNGAYVHDRRGGERDPVAEIRSHRLGRHAEDELVSVAIAEGLQSDAVVVCGTNLDANVDPEMFERICRDVRAGGAVVVADLSGEELRSALLGGIDLLKVSHEELLRDGWATSDDEDDLFLAVDGLRAAGARDVVVSCGARAMLAALGSHRWRVTPPSMSVVDGRGAGDSMTAALAACAARRMDVVETLRLATAAAALNVTRHGLASGHRGAIDALTRLVEMERLDRRGGPRHEDV